VVEVVSAIEQRGAPVAANKALKALVCWPSHTRAVAGRGRALAGKGSRPRPGAER
jgi:hypothetical protein